MLNICLALVLSIAAVSAQTIACPEVSVNIEYIGVDTKASFAELERRFVDYSI